MERLTSTCISCNLSNKRYSSVPCLKSLSTTDDVSTSLPVTASPTLTLKPSKFYIPEWSTSSKQIDCVNLNIFPSCNEFTPLNQEKIDEDYLQMYTVIPHETFAISKNYLIRKKIIQYFR